LIFIALSSAGDRVDDAAIYLITLYRSEQDLEVASAKTVVTLAVDKFEEQGTQRFLREDLQLGLRIAVGYGLFEQDARDQ